MLFRLFGDLVLREENRHGLHTRWSMNLRDCIYVTHFLGEGLVTMWVVSSVQLPGLRKVDSKCCSEMLPTLLLKQFQCLSDQQWPFQGRLSSASSFLFLSHPGHRWCDVLGFVLQVVSQLMHSICTLDLPRHKSLVDLEQLLGQVRTSCWQRSDGRSLRPPDSPDSAGLSQTYFLRYSKFANCFAVWISQKWSNQREASDG